MKVNRLNGLGERGQVVSVVKDDKGSLIIILQKYVRQVEAWACSNCRSSPLEWN